MSSANPITHRSALKTSIPPVPSRPWRDLHSCRCLHTAAAPNHLLSECDPSVHHILTLPPILASCPLVQRYAALLAAAVSASMVVRTAGSSQGAGQFIPPVVCACSWSFQTTLNIGTPVKGLLCSSCSLLLNAFSSLAVNCHCLESKGTVASVCPNSLVSALHVVMGSAPRMDLASQLRRSWRSSRLCTFLGSHGSVLPYSSTAWAHTT
jgi:hypothetical protein